MSTPPVDALSSSEGNGARISAQEESTRRGSSTPPSAAMDETDVHSAAEENEESGGLVAAAATSAATAAAAVVAGGADADGASALAGLAPDAHASAGAAEAGSGNCGGRQIDDLPDEVLGLVFAHLPFLELVSSISHVCRRWLDVILLSVRGALDLSQEVYDSVDDRFLEHLRVFRLHTLDLTNCYQVTETGMRALQRCDSLQRLTMLRHQFSRPMFLEMLNLPHLEFLDIMGDSTRGQHRLVEPFPAARSLRHLVTSIWPWEWRVFSALETLELRAATDIAGAALVEVPTLRHLVLSQSSVSFDSLARLKGLQSLTLRDCNLYAKFRTVSSQPLWQPFLKCLEAMASLRHLELSHMRCDVVRDSVFMEVLAARPELETLRIVGHGRVGDWTLFSMADALPHLTSVAVCGSRTVTDAGVQRLVRSCKKLQSLSFASCTHVTDVAVEAICDSLPGLQHLDVSHCLHVSAYSVHLCSVSLMQLKSIALYGLYIATSAPAIDQLRRNGVLVKIRSAPSASVFHPPPPTVPCTCNMRPSLCHCPPIECMHCHARIPNPLQRDHYEACSRFPQPCPLPGCQLSVPRDALAAHLRVCGHNTVVCSMCSKSLQLTEWRQHIDRHNTTSGRLHARLCPCCHAAPADLAGHMLTCSSWLLNCPACGASMLRRDLDAHRATCAPRPFTYGLVAFLPSDAVSSEA